MSPKYLVQDLLDAGLSEAEVAEHIKELGVVCGQSHINRIKRGVADPRLSLYRALYEVHKKLLGPIPVLDGAS